MCRPIGIPEPVIGVEGYSLVVMHLLVEATPVVPILREAYHALIGTIEGGVEDSKLFGGPALQLDLIEGLGPFVASVLSDQS